MTKIGLLVAFLFTPSTGSGDLLKSRFSLYFFSEFFVAIAPRLCVFSSLCVFVRNLLEIVARKDARLKDSQRPEVATTAEAAQGSSKLFYLAYQLLVAASRFVYHVAARALNE